MIVFLTFFLGLTIGSHSVAVQVSERVARVELQLDGQVAAVLEGEPWHAEVDFGRGLFPHELVAVAYDQRGEEVTRVRQPINLPRPRVEVKAMLERDSHGRVRRARLAWASVEKLPIEKVRAFFDGTPLEVSDEQWVTLPNYDPDRLHYLVAEVTFEGGYRTETAAAIGGKWGDAVSTELTAVPVRMQGGAEPPRRDQLADWLLRRGQPLEVVAIDRPPADLYVVRGFREFERIRRGLHRRMSFSGAPKAAPGHFRGGGLKPGERIFLVHPAMGKRSRAAGIRLFPMSPGLELKGRDGIAQATTAIAFRNRQRHLGPQQLLDAVAVAGLQAAAGRPRAVVALVGPDDPDKSLLDWPSVLAYLRAVRVPLHVWTASRDHPEAGSVWDRAERVIPDARFRNAIKRLREDLDGQIIVWVRGTWLPQEIELSPKAAEQVSLVAGGVD